MTREGQIRYKTYGISMPVLWFKIMVPAAFFAHLAAHVSKR